MIGPAAELGQPFALRGRVENRTWREARLFVIVPLVSFVSTCPHLILAESSSLNGLINAILLVLGATAVPALIGFIVLLVGRFRSPVAYPALILGLLTVLPAGTCCGWLYREQAWVGYGVAAGLPFLLGVVICGLAWWSRQRPVSPTPAIAPVMPPP